MISFSAIEIGGGKPKVFGIPINQNVLTGVFYEGEMIEFNFYKFWKKSKADFSFTESKTHAIWEVNASNKHYKIELYLECKLKDMLEINYESLNGGTGIGNIKIFKNDNTLIDDITIFNAGCEYGEFVI